MDLPSVQARPHPNQIRHSLGEALLSMNTSPLNEKLSLRPDQERRQGQADAALPHLPEWNEYLLRLVEKGKSPAGNRTVTLLNHYMTEKSILVMIDPRPTIVPGEPASRRFYSDPLESASGDASLVVERFHPSVVKEQEDAPSASCSIRCLFGSRLSSPAALRQ